MLKDLILKNRSYRRFEKGYAIDEPMLRELIEYGICSASGANRQPLKYALSYEPIRNAIVFKHLEWAGYLTDWKGPAEGERPSAYIIILGDTAISKHFGCDHGIAAQSIMLGAVEKDLGGCMVGSIKRKALHKALNLPATCEILLVLALGKPIETVTLEPLGPDGSIKYWRDSAGVHHVPKRSVDDVIVG